MRRRRRVRYGRPRASELRDELECVFFVLVQHRRDKLGEVLAVVDDAVTSAWSSLPPAGSLRDPRLQTVALLEPAAWWGALSEDSRIAEIKKWRPKAPPVLLPPAPSQLTGGLAIEPWLAAAAHDALESDTPLDKVAAVGLMGRLWSPVDRAEAAAARQRSLAGAGPGQDGRAWWASIPEEDREGLVSTALLRVDDLADALGDLSDSVAEDPEAARPALLRWLHARDDLASIAFLARSSSPGGVLETALERLDETAAGHHSFFVRG